MPIKSQTPIFPLLNKTEIFQQVLVNASTLINYIDDLTCLFMQMFNAFKWKTASLLIHDYGLCKFGGTTIYLALKEKDIHVAEYLRMAEDMSDISDGDILQYLRNFRERARS